MLISKLSGHEVKPAQYLTELMCERKANKEQRKIQAGFWHDDYWKTFYVQQIQAANSLLKLYAVDIIIAAVKDKRASWMYSLRSPQLKPILADYQKKAENKAKIEKETKQKQANKSNMADSIQVPEQQVIKPAITPKKNNIISKLKGL